MLVESRFRSRANVCFSINTYPLWIRKNQQMRSEGGGTGFQPVSHGQDGRATSGMGVSPMNHGLEARATLICLGALKASPFADDWRGLLSPARLFG